MWSWSFMFPLLVSLISLVLLVNCDSLITIFSFSIFFNDVSYDSIFLVDYISLTFIHVVGVVSFSVLLYTLSYMDNSVMKKKFVITMVMFISSMFLLSVSADLFWVMVGWDGLGLSSLGLIMFFQNWKSFNSAMVTFLSNRLGDSMIILSIIWLVGVGKTISLFSQEGSIFFLFLLLGAFSKSAQAPFSAWLPLAMAAPTPVSSLVHSSTLVTAGVYLLIRFNNFLSESEKDLIFIFSSLTIVLATSSSMGEYDLKKIIALSTLSHIGLMMMFVSLSIPWVVLIHFFTHAMFKSLLFMIAGDLIHSNLNFQDIRKLSMSRSDIPLMISLIFSLLSMSGLPFLSGFFSKELFFLSSLEDSINPSMVVLFVGVVMTASYSVRILIHLLSNELSVSGEVNKSSNWKIFLMMGIFSISSGSLVNLILKVNFCKSSEDLPVGSPMKFILLSLLVLGTVIGIKVSLIRGKISPFLLKWVTKMWWISSTYTFFQKEFFLFSWVSFMKFDSKGMVDSIVNKSSAYFKMISKKSLGKLAILSMVLVGFSFHLWGVITICCEV